MKYYWKICFIKRGSKINLTHIFEAVTSMRHHGYFCDKNSYIKLSWSTAVCKIKCLSLSLVCLLSSLQNSWYRNYLFVIHATFVRILCLCTTYRHPSFEVRFFSSGLRAYVHCACSDISLKTISRVYKNIWSFSPMYW